MNNANRVNFGYYDSLDDYDEIIIKRVNDNEWQVTAKKNIEDDKANTINFTTDNVKYFSLNFLNGQKAVEPDVVGFDYKEK